MLFIASKPDKEKMEPPKIGHRPDFSSFATLALCKYLRNKYNLLLSNLA